MGTHLYDVWEWLRMSQFVKTVKFERLGCGVNGSRILDSNVKPGCKITTVQCSNHQFRRSLIPKSSFEKQRLRHWWRPNVLKILRHGKSWTDEYSAITGPGTYKKSYVTSTPEKLNAGSDELEKLIRSRKAKRILDAGAGSCSLDGELLRKGYLPHLQNYLAFGAYDCSMIRICAERGSISFQHDWRQSRYPICAEAASTIWFFSSGECIISFEPSGLPSGKLT